MDVADPTSVLVASVIREASPHHLDAWEGDLRRGFTKLVESYQTGECRDLSLVLARLTELNRRYRTRYALDQLDETSKIVYDAISEEGWWHAPPPRLLGCDDSTAEVIAGVPMQVLSRITLTGNKRPYSLLTKFLFFCFPETFPIYDSWVGESIQLWAYLAIDTRGDEWKLFSRSRLAEPSGSGYRGVVEFYRRLWRGASPTQQEQLQARAEEAEQRLGMRVTVLDLIDKLLWRAGGDPLRLGLRSSGWTLTPDAS